MCFAGFDVLVDDAKGEEILFFESLFVSRLEVITLMVLTLIMAKLQVCMDEAHPEKCVPQPALAKIQVKQASLSKKFSHDGVQCVHPCLKMVIKHELT